MEKINILGLNISVISKDALAASINSYLKDGLQHRIITPNPEIMLSALEDEEYFYLVNTADLAIPDGVGLKFAAWLLGKNLTRLSGADFVRDILAAAEKRGLKVAVFNWNKGLSSKKDILNALKENYPKLKCIAIDILREWNMPYYAEANAFQPDIILTALGAPWQDKFNYQALSKMPYVKIAIGVGGAIDFLTGKIKRAPKLLRSLGLEWLWRLCKQPWRLKRIYRAVMVFPIVFLRWRFILRFFYRQNVAIILYKKQANDYYILVVERQGEKNHWQLPQGGLDGNTIKHAGARELREEIGSTNFRIVTSYGFLYKYKIQYEQDNENYRQKPSSRHRGYRGQKQGLLIAEFLGNDSDIKIKYWDHSAWRWVKSRDLVSEVHHIRKKAAKVYLDKFNELTKKTDEIKL